MGVHTRSVPGGFNIEGATPPGGLFAGEDRASSPAVYFDVDDIESAIANTSHPRSTLTHDLEGRRGTR